MNPGLVMHRHVTSLSSSGMPLMDCGPYATQSYTPPTTLLQPPRPSGCSNHTL
jgi:hypothetical protein